MADTKISALTAATTPLAGTEVLPIVQSGTTKKVTADTFLLASNNLSDVTAATARTNLGLGTAATTAATDYATAAQGTKADNAAVLVTTPKILGCEGTPVGIAPTGSVAVNGALTLGTSLSGAYGKCWLYFPADACFSGSGAGMYYVQMSTGLVGTVFTNTRVSTDPLTPPASPTGIVGTGSAYTGFTSTLEVVQRPVAANSMGINGAITYRGLFGSIAGTSLKTPLFKLGGQTLSNNSVWSNTGLSFALTVTVQNQGSAVRQSSPSHYDSQQSQTIGPVRTTVDTTTNTTASISVRLVTATDCAVMEGYTITLFPGV